MERVDRGRALPSVASLIRYHLGLIAVSVGLALGLAGLYVSNRAPSYTATATVLLSPAPGNPLTPEAASTSGIQATVALTTETQLVRSAPVYDLVAQELGRPVPDAGEQLNASVPSNTQMLEIVFTSATPERAREGAQAFAEGYLEYRATRAEAVQEARIEQLEEQISDTEENLRGAIRDASQSEFASQEVQVFADRLASLNTAMSAAELVSTYPGSVTSAAVPPEKSNEMPAWVYMVAATFLGILIGVGLALLREWRRDLLRDADIGTELGVPVLATIHPQGWRLAAEAGPEVHESYRQLRGAVVANAPRPYVLAVTDIGIDSERDDGILSMEVAANLAVVLAEAKLSVVLVATDPREHKLEAIFGVKTEAGLADVVLDGASVNDSLVATHGISLLPAGGETEGSADLTATSGFRAAVEELRQRFDYVVLAAASAGSADGDAVMLGADSALLVLTPDKTTRTLLSATLDRLDRLGVETIGAARVDPSGTQSSVASPGSPRRGAGRPRARERRNSPMPKSLARPARKH